MAKRRPTPLFEYVYQKDREATRPAVSKGPPPPRRADAPKARPEPLRTRQAQPTPTESGTNPGAWRTASARALLAKFDPRRHIGVPVAALYAFVAVVVVVAILVYGVAFQAGYSNAERQLVDRIAGASPETDGDTRTNTSPPAILNSDRGPRRTTENAANRDQEVKNPQRPETDASKTLPAASNVLATDVLTDTRVEGSNYLHIVSRLSRDEAVRAAAFLSENGVPAVAVNVDTGRAPSNNSATWSVYSRLGIPSTEYSSSVDLRNQHKAEVARLGAIWQREHKGTSSFAAGQTAWEKFRKGN